MLINEALKKIKESLNFNTSEIVPINLACDRILAQDIIAQKDLPCFDNSALDGYAVKFEDQGKPFKVIDSVFAGEARATFIKNNECIKIMTGAKIPTGADTIARFEDCVIKDDLVFVPKNLKKGDAYRVRAEEVKRGEILLKKGEKLSAAGVMMLAAQGISFVSVKTRPKIGIFSSGDEIIEPWQVANNDEIYNANAVAVGALLAQNGFKSSYLGIIKDDLSQTINAFKNAQNFDILISSGGASKGEADYMKKAMLNLGFTELFERVNMRPGGPAKAYTKDNKLIFILPGNPMAAFLCAYLLILPLLLGRDLERFSAKINQDIKIKSGRANVVFGKFDGENFNVTDDNKYGSGMIKPLLKSNAIYLSNPNESELKAGSKIKIIKFA